MILEETGEHNGKVWVNTLEEVEFFYSVHPPKVEIGKKLTFKGVDVEVIDVVRCCSATGDVGFLGDTTKTPSIVGDFKYLGYWIVYFNKTVPTGFWNYSELDEDGTPVMESTTSSTDTVVSEILNGKHDDTIPFSEELNLPLFKDFVPRKSGVKKKVYKKGGKIDDEVKRKYIAKNKKFIKEVR